MWRTRLTGTHLNNGGVESSMGLGNKLQHAWNAFIGNRDPTYSMRDIGAGYAIRPDRPRFTGGNERTIINAIYNRIAIDAATIEIKHVYLDEEGRYKETVKSGLNNCLDVEANIDQTGRAFKHDIFMSLLDEGYIAVVPVDTTLDPKNTDSYEIVTMRTGKIIEWRPQSVKVKLYNEQTGMKEDIWCPKKTVAILENPFYSVMNERNSTMQRLIRKLNLLDAIDEQSGSGKIDMIIQLPYVVKTPTQEAVAEQRRRKLEKQMRNSKYGIGYIDGAEKITQLNRPLENNLLKQVEYLTTQLYSQLGMTQEILNGTADEKAMNNYYSRTIEPLVAVPVDEFKRKFLTKTARTRGQSILYFRDLFKLVPIDTMIKAADTLTRNEIMSKNEIRQGLGMKPSNDPKADQLINSNLNHPEELAQPPVENYEDYSQEGEIQNGASE